LQVVDLTTTTHVAKADPITTAQEILDFQQLVRMTPIAETVAKYAIELVRATRMKDPSAPEIVKKYVNYGGSVRAAQNLVLGSKARALMKGRYHVSFRRCPRAFSFRFCGTVCCSTSMQNARTRRRSNLLIRHGS